MMRTIIAFGFDYDDIKNIALDLGYLINYDLGFVYFQDMITYEHEPEATAQVIKAVKEKYSIIEDLTGYNFCCETGEQYWTKPILLMPTHQWR